MTYPKVSIIILNWNGLEDTIECLESLKKITYPNYEVIMVDNGSKGNDTQVLEEKFGDYIHLIKNDKNYPEDAYRMYFTSNHDENSWNGTEFERMGDAAETFAVFSFMIPGMPLIYSGQEAALNKPLKFFEKDTIVWGEVELEKFYTNLIQIKKKNKALWNGTSGGKLVRINSSDDENVFAFVREKDENKIFAVFNFSGENQNVTVEGDKFVGEFINVFSGEEVKFLAKEKLELEPWGYFVFEGK